MHLLMHRQVSEKVKGGKLVRLHVECSDIIQKVTITGDFFLHPEDKLELIEKALIGLPLTLSEEDLQRRIKAVVDAECIEMVGIAPDVIARLIKQAVTQ